MANEEKFKLKTVNLTNQNFGIQQNANDVRMLRRFSVRIGSELLLFCGLCMYVMKDVHGQEGKVEENLQSIQNNTAPRLPREINRKYKLRLMELLQDGCIKFR